MMTSGATSRTRYQMPAGKRRAVVRSPERSLSPVGGRRVPLVDDAMVDPVRRLSAAELLLELFPDIGALGVGRGVLRAFEEGEGRFRREDGRVGQDRRIDERLGLVVRRPVVVVVGLLSQDLGVVDEVQ